MPYLPTGHSNLAKSSSYGPGDPASYIGVSESQPCYQNGSLEDYAKTVGVSSSLAQQNQLVGFQAATSETAHDVLSEIAGRAIKWPHQAGNSEIQILAAFVLGYNSNPSR